MTPKGSSSDMAAILHFTPGKIQITEILNPI